MDGKFLLEDQQEVADELAVIFDALQQLSEVQHRFGHALFLLSDGTQNFDVGRSCQSVDLQAEQKNPQPRGKRRFGDGLEMHLSSLQPPSDLQHASPAHTAPNSVQVSLVRVLQIHVQLQSS